MTRHRTPSGSWVRNVSRESYVYGLPTVDMYRILHSFCLDPSSPEFKAGFNRLWHSRALADPSDRSIVAMNVDTPYSYAWLDLRAEPVVLTMPPFEETRYVSAMVSDLYTYIVGYLSPRTTGHAGARALVAGPRWTGSTPDGLPVLRCPTELALVLVRTQLFDDDDLPNVVRVQDGMAVQTLSAWRGGVAVEPAPALRPIAAVDVRRPPGADFLRVLGWMLALMPVLPEDATVRADLAELGVGDEGLDLLLADLDKAEAVLAGLRDGMGDVAERAARVRSSAELFGSREHFAGDYLTRAAGTLLGILGNAAEEYLGVGYAADADGNRFTGERRYTITFPPGGLPPVDAFWSITVYDADRLLYANEIDRYVLGSRQRDAMATAEDGSLTVLIQHDRPFEDLVANWLPCPTGPFNLAFRTYLPRAPIRDGRWTAPPVVPADEGS